MTRFTKRTVVRTIIGFAVGLPLAFAATLSPAKEPVSLRIGWQKGSNLSVIKARGALDNQLSASGVSIKWIEFPAGPQMLEGLNVGAIDLGIVGETPPVFAQAAGANLVYVGNEPPSPKAEAILIPATSQLRTVADLKGKRVVLNKGSNVHYFLVKALEGAGLTYGDVQVVFLKPSDARAAFESGDVDAWAIWDPYTAAAEAQVGAKRLVEGPGIIDNYNFYIATRTFAEQHPEIITLALNEINANDQWIASHLSESAAIVGPQIGLPDNTAAVALGRYGYGARLISDDVVTKQQKMADVLFSLGLIPNKLDIRSVVWHPNP